MPKASIDRGLKKLTLKLSGTKGERVERLLNETRFEPRSTLSLMDNNDLMAYAESLDIPKRRSKDDQIENILSTVFILKQIQQNQINNNEKPIELSNNKLEIIALKGDKENRESGKGHNLDEILNEIKNWTPPKRYPHESAYQEGLRSWLEAKGHKVRIEEGDSKTDILVDDWCAIEVKKEPRLQDYDRAGFQLLRHCQRYGCVIAVFFDVRGSDQFEDFVERCEIALNKYDYRIVKI